MWTNHVHVKSRAHLESAQASSDHRSFDYKKMRSRSIRLSCLATLLLLGLGRVYAITEEEAETDKGYASEARGVNPYTAPSIAQIFQRLDGLRPLPFEQLQRHFPAASHGNREQLGLNFGGLVADGFLLVACERKNSVDELGRALLRQARSLGVAQRVMRHSASLTDLGHRGDWQAMRRELAATQNDVEQAMIDLRDQRMANLISLGGWLRGLEICSGAITARYSQDRANTLMQPDLVDYFSEELRKLPPAVGRTPLFDQLRNGMASVRPILKKSSPGSLTAADVRAINAQARNMNAAILRD